MSVYLDDRLLTDTVNDVFTVDGALAPAVELRSTQPVANAPGLFGTGVTINPRTISVGLDVWPSTTVDRVTVLDTLERRVSGLRLFRMTDAPDRELYVTLTDVKVEFYHIAIPRCFVALQFTAVDPYRWAVGGESGGDRAERGRHRNAAADAHRDARDERRAGDRLRAAADRPVRRGRVADGHERRQRVADERRVPAA